jgi:hypothetical protein
MAGLVQNGMLSLVKQQWRSCCHSIGLRLFNETGAISARKLIHVHPAPGSLPLVYVFNQWILQVRCSGFLHSDLLGSTPVHGSPEAYRSVPRPSSALDAKAFTISS